MHHNGDTSPVLAAASAMEEFAAELLRRVGATDGNARWLAGRVIAADLAAHESHGLRRLVEYVQRVHEGGIDPAATPVIVDDTGATVTLDGRHAFGHVVMRHATDLAVERARAHGIAAIAVRRSDHAGRVADYCELAAAAGIILMVFLNDSGSEQDVAPPGGLEGRLSTNPIGVGIPRRSSPHLVLDMATSVVARGRVSEETDRGAEIPDAWVAPTGYLRPVGGYKGFGLALVAETLAGALSGAGTVSAARGHDDQGIFIVALDPARFRPLPGLVDEVESFLAYVKDVPMEPGADPVRVPGEVGAAATAVRLAAGLPVQRFTWDRLAVLAAGVGLAMPEPLSSAG